MRVTWSLLWCLSLFLLGLSACEGCQSAPPALSEPSPDQGTPDADLGDGADEVLTDQGQPDLPPGECAADADCDDGLYCNGVERCQRGRCVIPDQDPCQDNVACTLDRCLEDLDRCEHLPDDSRCTFGRTCDPKAGCFGAPECESDDACDDGLFCNGAERCDPATGRCLDGLPPDEDDGVSCTATVCQEDPPALVHVPVDGACDDGLFCNGVEACDLTLGCVAGAPPALEDGVACTVDTCDEALDEVVHAPLDAACDDDRFCNGAETCDPARGCVSGAAPAVDDGVSCTLDLCDEALARVVHLANDRACDDGLFCNGEERCDAALGCLPGAAPAVDDGIFCTLDACDERDDLITHSPQGERCGPDALCDPQAGCVEAPECTSDADCDDGRFCNGAERCDPNQRCQAGAAPTLDDGVSCTLDTCDEANDEVLHAPQDGSCDDGLFCNGAERCDVALGCLAGASPTLDDGVSCTLDACDEASDRVTHTPRDVSCDNGLFCDGAERCDAVLGCLAGVPPASSDGVSCTVDACDEANDRVTHTPRDASCDDGLFCNGAERCDAALGCLAGAAPTLDDGVSCTLDLCDEASDEVLHAPQGSRCGPDELCDPQAGCVEAPECASDADCDDGRFCNGAERCDPNQRCQAGAAPTLGDGVSCTRDTCDEANDRVIHAPDDGSCDDGLFCNGAERCDVALGCVAGDSPTVDDGVSCTVDACDEDSDRVIHAPRDVSCDDGRFCNGAERCDAVLGCVAGVAPALNDRVSCTVDRCDEANDRVTHSPLDSFCSDNQFCNGEERCDTARGCRAGVAPTLDDGVSCTADVCDEVNDRVIHAPDDGACEDGDPCTADVCAESGCLRAPVVVCAPDDACCPGGCGVGEDNDCPSTCGDGVLDPELEQCEAPADCARGGRCVDCACVEGCEDGIDNDLDGALDCADADCAGEAACRLVIPMQGLRSSQEGAAAWRTTGSGYEPPRRGHTLPWPYNQCGDPSTYPFLASADYAGPAPEYTPLDPQSPGGAHGVAPFEGTWSLSEVMARYGRGPGFLRLSFGRMDLGDDVEGVDWFFTGDVETRYYRGGTLWLKWGDVVILEAPMPTLALRIDYNNAQSCSDEAIEAESELFTAAIFMDVSQGAPIEAREVAQALLADLALGGELRLYSQSLEPALQQEFTNQGRLGAFYELPRLVLESAP